MTTSARPVAQRVAQAHWGYPFEVLIGPPTTQLVARRFDPPRPGRSPVAVSRGLSPIARLEQLRRDVHDAIALGGLCEAALDEWEDTALRYGQATRYRPAGVLLDELGADFAELQRLLQRRHSASVVRGLTQVTAQMAGLMFLTLIKLNAPLAAHNWARTARVAAAEAGDPALSSWVRAQEAYLHYYVGDLAEALVVAQHAQSLAGATECTGVPLAAALEARALAALGRQVDARRALWRAEATLVADPAPPSAFTYSEAQLRFHEGNALTHLRDTRHAWAAQDRALQLYPASDYLDRALVQLDRATCLVHDGEVREALTHATTTLTGLSDAQRTGIIWLRGRQLLASLDEHERALPPARDFRDLLMITASAEGTEP